ncbi:dipicolinate synthase subunit DpsA [Jeotgalibacillus soli]|uniref:Dipicolinate synthase subunit A n=1 Tax=Jeotgalibacillus soli TaxID=889306 RepID=A0A0C2VKF7_9BACL|nr:dipicolinate synthase subunit DpsA [Jeotgalibacillus soli]KIL44936.1 hypothetical protein KP78_24800 [Jeotgalibacillus soli]
MKNSSMLNGSCIAIIGGDARQKEIANHCQLSGANVYAVGFDQLSMTEPGFDKVDVYSLPYDQLDAIVFPVSGVSENGEVRSSFSSKPVKIRKEDLNSLTNHCLIFSGINTPWLEDLSHEVICLMDEDDIAIQNSIPTAEGVLWLLLQHTDHTIHHSTMLVTGFGRVGMTVARTLKALGAHVIGGTSNRGEKARMEEMGIEPLDLTELAEKLPDCDAWINTIPSDTIFPSEILSLCSRECLVIELASGPKAITPKLADSMGIRYINAPSLPGLIAPKTAGFILAKTIIERIVQKRK